MSSEKNPTLPESLEKLEIVPSICITKLTSEASIIQNQNPFLKNFENHINLLNPINDDVKIKLFGPKCECENQTLKIENAKIERTIKSTIQFKSKTRQSKNTILKEPVLKFIGKCIHKNHIKHKRCKSENSEMPDKTEDSTNIDNLNNNIFSSCSLFGNNIEHNLDFSSLAKEYSTLTLAQKTDTCNSEEIFSKSFRSRSSLKSSENKISHLHHHSSCSQQARMNVNNITTCDITIDELACYFETFVHIPKKMSTMAEMMYI